MTNEDNIGDAARVSNWTLVRERSGRREVDLLPLEARLRV